MSASFLPAHQHLLPPTLDELLPETQQAVRVWLHRQEPHLLAEAFAYQSLPPSGRLTYELVGWHNFAAYLSLFAADPSPFVDARFKSRAALEAYAASLLTDLRYSRKHGACDWLVRNRANGQPVGVLHLYDLSQERIGSWRPHCAVGYALAEPHRRQGYGTEALTQLLAQAAALFEQTEARAISAATNAASEALLRHVGFVVLEERPASRHQAATRLWQRRLG